MFRKKKRPDKPSPSPTPPTNPPTPAGIKIISDGTLGGTRVFGVFDHQKQEIGVTSINWSVEWQGDGIPQLTLIIPLVQLEVETLDGDLHLIGVDLTGKRYRAVPID